DEVARHGSLTVNKSSSRRDYLLISGATRKQGGVMRMRAALMPGYKQPLRIDEISVPELGPGEVLIQVRATGMCRSDYQLIDGLLPSPAYIPVSPRPRSRGPRHSTGHRRSRVRRPVGRRSGGRERGLGLRNLPAVPWGQRTDLLRERSMDRLRAARRLRGVR